MTTRTQTETGNRLSDMVYDEVSLVTRGANQDSVVVLFKADVDESELSKRCNTNHAGLKKGEACKDCGMKPGKNGKMHKSSDDSEEGIHEDPDHPGTLNTNGNIHKENEMPTGTKTPPQAPDLSALPEEVRKSVEEHIAALEKDNAELLEDNEQMAAALSDLDDDGDDDEYDGDDDDSDVLDVTKMDDSEIAKLDPVMQSIVKQAQVIAKRVEQAEAIAKAEQDRRESAEATELAKSLTTHVGTDNATLATALLDIKKNCTETTVAIITETLRSANEVAKSGGAIGDENGSADSVNVVSKAQTALEAKRDEIMKRDPNITKEAALLRAAQENPDLYAEHVKG